MEKIESFTFLFDTLFENVCDRLHRARSLPEGGPPVDLPKEMFTDDTWKLVDRYLCQCNAEAGMDQYRLYRQGMIDCVSLLREIGVLA